MAPSNSILRILGTSCRRTSYSKIRIDPFARFQSSNPYLPSTKTIQDFRMAKVLLTGWLRPRAGG